jgi:Spy/CpxP family protein refolding chaperone
MNVEPVAHLRRSPQPPQSPAAAPRALLQRLRRSLARVTVAIAFALLLAPLAHAEGRDDDWLKGKLFPPDVVLKHQAQLKLTDAQRQAIRKEIVAVQAKVATVDFDLMDAAVALQEAMEKPTVDKALVLEKADRVFEADARKKRAWIEMLVTIRNLLTPEQVAYLKKVTTEGAP